MLASLTAAFLAGLVGSPHCMGMCGVFAVACGGVRRGVAWHVGRLTTYAALGAVAGAVGLALPGPAWVAAVASVALLVWFSAALAGLVREPALRVPGLGLLSRRAARGEGAGSRFVLGLATGLLPCGLVYAALAVPVASGSPLTGALAMVAFGAGTVPALAALTLGARRTALRDVRARRVLAAGVLVLGLLSVGMRTSHMHSMSSHPDAPHGATPSTAPAQAGG